MKEGEITPGITSEEYVSRRNKLLELLPDKSLAIIASASVKMMTDVVPYTFRQDADYFYITGCQQPGGIAVLGHECGLCMFMPQPSPEVSQNLSAYYPVYFLILLLFSLFFIFSVLCMLVHQVINHLNTELHGDISRQHHTKTC